MLTEDGPLRIDIPRDREGSFEPVLIPKHERRFTGFDDKIIAVYARRTRIPALLGNVRFWRTSGYSPLRLNLPDACCQRLQVVPSRVVSAARVGR